jgi:uncharacterized protein (DUF1330 family)
VVVELPTIDAARAWYASLEYADALALSKAVLRPAERRAGKAHS